MINQQNDVHIQSKALPKDSPTTYLNTKFAFVIFCLLDYYCFVNFLFCLFNMSDSIEKLFAKLEANDKTVVESLKKCIRESKPNDTSLINGLYDYYLRSNSLKCIDMFIVMKEPQEQCLFERLKDSLAKSKSELKTRVQALTLLGHIATSHPTWLQKLPDHALFKELLEFLKVETELLPLVSALLVLIIFIPMFPSSIGKKYLDDIFCIFKRLAGWNLRVPGGLVEVQLIHLQIALHALFLLLYGMYPSNFLQFLQLNFKDKNDPVFSHTIKPMMDTVKMNPSLVVTSKEKETTTERWQKLAMHDVIVECERFSLDITDRCPHETCQNTTEFRSRSGTMNSTLGTNGNNSPYSQPNIKTLTALQKSGSDIIYTPSKSYHVQTPPITESGGTTIHHIQGVASRNNYSASQEGSPPEAAIEATPETTPVRDFNTTPVKPSSAKSSVARAITSFHTNASGHIVSGTPTGSVPSSPMRKEPSPFIFPSSSSVILGNAVVKESSPGYPGVGEYRSPGSVSAFARASGVPFSQHKIHKLTKESAQLQGSDSSGPTNKPPPSSPLKIQHLEGSGRMRMESPLTQEDEEVSSISVASKKTKTPSKLMARSNESILPDIETDGKDLEHGSPCSAGGLHMPNSESVNSFKKRIRRFRYHSQCNTEPDHVELSTGSSPGNGMSCVSTAVVKRAKSWPDLAQLLQTPKKDKLVNTSNGVDVKSSKQKFVLIHAHTQTEVFWPMPYEHLFLMIFPSLKEESIDAKLSPSPSPALALQSAEQYKPSLYDILDKYIESCVATADNNTIKDQLQLVHQQLLFERHRREVHAYGNRRLLSDAKSTRLLEECNSALRDQVQLEQKEIDDLRSQLQCCKRDVTEKDHFLSYTLTSIENQCANMKSENAMLKDKIRELELDISKCKKEYSELDKKRQISEAALFDAYAEVKVAKEQALVGEQVKQELQRVNTELLLKGELHVKYREKLSKLEGLKQYDEITNQHKRAFEEEVKSLQSVIEAKSVVLESYKVRLFELEQQLSQKDETISEQKRTLASVNEEHEALIKSVESKYENQLAINRALEQKILELKNKLEIETANKKMNSPDTSSCLEVQATTTAGLSSHSSPLSASLASSVGSNLQDKEMRNLQAFVEEKDS
ncbi:hamartin-like isoform X2 [Rhynchophorus ferrugineus]|uniref:hamartin-like isoform X2 n=1 Tax=Rhynchophorus ferrugineus TaxID=354439 RepID=UPI003FCEBFCF